MLTYPKQALESAKNAVNGDEFSKAWLIKNNFEALVKMIDAVTYRDAKAVEYLLLNKRFILAAFSNAVWEDKKALNILMDKKEYIWAAMANYINGDKKAGFFLQKNKLDTYLSLADAIQKKIQKLNDQNSNFFNSGPFKV